MNKGSIMVPILTLVAHQTSLLSYTEHGILSVISESVCTVQLAQEKILVRLG